LVAVYRGDFDARHESHPGGGAGGGRRLASGDGIVIGHGEDRNASRGCAGDELDRGAAAIRFGCVCV
jgi:hypothetical protein